MAHSVSHGVRGRHHAQNHEYRDYDRVNDDGYVEEEVVADRSTTVRGRERYGGLNIGASFFGWIVAAG